MSDAGAAAPSAQPVPLNSISVRAEHVKLLLVDDDQDNLLALQAVLDPLKEELMQDGPPAQQMQQNQLPPLPPPPPASSAEGPTLLGRNRYSPGDRRDSC